MMTTEPDAAFLSSLAATDEPAYARLRARLAGQAQQAGILDVAYRTIGTPVGELLLAATERGLVRVAYPAEDHDAVLAALAGQVSPRVLRAPARLDAVARELDEYFTGTRRAFGVSLDLQLAHGFRRVVLEHLREIGYGTTASYGAVAAASGSPAAVRGDPVFFGADLRVPVLCVESETDLMNLGYLEARQDDAGSFVLWEIAGAAHADVYTFVAGPIDTGRLPIDELARAWVPASTVYGMELDLPVNAGPQHYVMNAAVAHLDRWVSDGWRPPESPRLEVRNGIFVTDTHGNVKGGIRTPQVDVPTAVLSGLGNSGHQIAFLCGSTTPFDGEKVGSLYASKDDYLERFAAATETAVATGFVLSDDASEMAAIAGINSPV